MIANEFFRREERILNKSDLGSAVGSDGLIAINDRDRTPIHESSPSFDDRPIVNQGSRCVDEEVCLLIRPLDFDPTIAIHR